MLYDRTPSFTQRFWSHVDRSGDCWRWTGFCMPNGYGQASAGRHHHGYAHRVAWELIAGDIPPGFRVLHTCDIRDCVRNDDEGVYVVGGVEYIRHGHLWLGTATANVADMIAKNRHAHGATHGTAIHPMYLPTGEAHHGSKLTADDVREIRRLSDSTDITQHELARRFGVGQGQIFKIVHRRNWKHV